MKEGVQLIRDISTSLRRFSRANSDRPVPCNVHDGINSTIMILKHRLKADDTHPEIEVIKNYGDLPQIECYAGQLNQVFMNLLSNAIDAFDESNKGESYQNIAHKIMIATDYRSDFYSLGVTFYQLLTGKLPFISQYPMELVHCHLAKLPISAHQFLSKIISKLMEKNAENRYQSALGLKHDLEICQA